MKVSDVGPPDAKIMLVGEAPGKTEEAKGIPFVGPAGAMLRQLLSHSGIDYNACRVTNIVDERPPGNNFSFFYSDKRRKTPSPRLENYWQILRTKIELHKPNIVIPLGGEALRAITGKFKISDWRGTPMAYKGIKVIPTYHPRYVISQYQSHPIVEMDFAKAKRESTSFGYCDFAVDINIRPTLSQAVDWLRDCKKYSRVSFDIETVGKHVRCIALARLHHRTDLDWRESICIPFFSFASSSLSTVSVNNNIISFGQRGAGNSYWSQNDEAVVLSELGDVFANKDIEKVGQNSISFDAPLIEDEFGIYINNHYMDTMHSWHVLYPEFPKSLSFLCSVLTDYPNYWTGHDPQDDDSEWTYCSWDSIVTLDVSYTIEDELKEAVV